MPRTLSSAMTLVFKVIFPSVWIGGFAVGTAQLFVLSHDSTGRPLPEGLKWTFLAILLAGGSFIWWYCVRLKRVRTDGTALYVSNYLKEVRVPLAEVVNVTENRWLNIHPVTLEFRLPTLFGQRIVFMPKSRPLLFLRSHPVVDELRTMAARAGGALAAG